MGHTFYLCMVTNKCHNCGSTEYINCSDGTIRCRLCGTVVGHANTNNFSSNASRGISNIGNNISTGTKNKVVAILLAFFFGGIGGQYFYLRRYVQGAVCLLFFWTYIPAIWGLVHGIILLSMSDDEFNFKYN